MRVRSQKGVGGRRFFRVPRVLGAEWVYLAPSRLPPPPPSPSLPSSSSSSSNPLLPLALYALSPLLPLLSPGHSALVSTHNGRSVLTLLTLHSACAPGSGHGEGEGKGVQGGGLKDDSNSPHVTKMPSSINSPRHHHHHHPPPFQRPSSNFARPYRWAVKPVPAGLAGTAENKTSSSLAKQTNRCLLWLTGDVEPCPHPARLCVAQLHVCSPSSSCCRAHTS